MQVYEYLNQAKVLDSQVERCKEKELELWTLATSTTQTSDGMPHGSSDPDKITNNMQKLMEARKRTNETIDKYVNVKQDIIEHIKALPKRQYEVLLWMYIEKREKRKPGQKWYYTWSEVAEKMGCTQQNVSKLRRKAIKNLQKILESEGEQQKNGCV